MSGIILPRRITCDESGFTGNKLLDAEQRFFAYGSLDLWPDEAADVIADARRAVKVQMPELKSKNLLTSGRGIAFMAEVLKRIEGRYVATVYDKRLALACKFFEYVYEPVLQRNNMLFYANNLHRFVATFLYMHMVASGAEVDDLVEEFEAFMRSLDPADAPSLFGADDPEHFGMMLAPVLRFARGYNVAIARESRGLRLAGPTGEWVLDLTLTAVFDHMRAWGERHPLLEVVVDDSKPMRALAPTFDVMINRPDRSHVELLGKRRLLTWNMAGPVTFANSKQDPAAQIADVVAGAAAACGEHGGDPRFHSVTEPVARHMLQECILPDWDVLDLAGDEAPVNMLILHELADRADAGHDPLIGMKDMYDVARANLPMYRRMQASGPDSIER